METFDAWFDRTIAESDVELGITDPATVRCVVALLEAASTPASSGSPVQLDAA